MILFFSYRWHLRFIRSEFRGQLPRPYSPHRNATWAIPEHMNDMNQEEPSRYVSSIPSDCCLFVVVVVVVLLLLFSFSFCSSFALYKNVFSSLGKNFLAFSFREYLFRQHIAPATGILSFYSLVVILSLRTSLVCACVTLIKEQPAKLFRIRARQCA